MKIKLSHKFEDIVSVNNLLLSWEEFLKGKRNKSDVKDFSFSLMDNILSLHRNLTNHTYKHGGYQAFNICDPKPRKIHKAIVQDRLVHHAVYRILYPFFERIFISDSFSCRKDKGTYKAIERFNTFNNKVSKNNTRTCWVLKCDIKKFFDNIDHEILKKLLAEYIQDKNILWLLGNIIDSFYSIKPGIGLPLGNLTSQLFVNIYMNKFDWFVKHKLKVKYYIRYADDFAIFSQSKEWLYKLLPKISVFLKDNLLLSIHPNKVSIGTIYSGVDFLGWVNFPDHKILRTKSKRRMSKRITKNNKSETLNSYLSLLKHGNTYNLTKKVILLSKIQNI